jgi:hypothetical protein
LRFRLYVHPRDGYPPETHDCRWDSKPGASLGTRSVVATALAEKAEQVHKAVGLLCDSAAAGDLKSAQALIPWINQALGMPTERVEVKAPSSLDDLENMDTATLERMVAEGRQRRLRLVQEAEQRAGAQPFEAESG